VVVLVKQKKYCTGEGRLRVVMLVTFTEEGLVAQIYGGEKPHVGAMALSMPGHASNNSGKKGCSTTAVPLPGHRESEVVGPVAERLAEKFRTPVVVVAGVHIENANAREIEELVNNCRKVAEMLISDFETSCVVLSE